MLLGKLKRIVFVFRLLFPLLYIKYIVNKLSMYSSFHDHILPLYVWNREVVSIMYLPTAIYQHSKISKCHLATLKEIAVDFVFF